MIYVLEDIAKALKAARQTKGLSQRALSAKAGLTQAQISKIENAAVDLQLSNLIELARALDLELMLVPRQAVSAVRSIGHTPRPPALSPDAIKAFNLMTRAVNFLAERLPSDEPAITQVQRTIGVLRPLPLTPNQVAALLRLARELQHDLSWLVRLEGTHLSNETLRATIREAARELESQRNKIITAHNFAPPYQARAAYRIDDGDDDEDFADG